MIFKPYKFIITHTFCILTVFVENLRVGIWFESARNGDVTMEWLVKRKAKCFSNKLSHYMQCQWEKERESNEWVWGGEKQRDLMFCWHKRSPHHHGTFTTTTTMMMMMCLIVNENVPFVAAKSCAMTRTFSFDCHHNNNNGTWWKWRQMGERGKAVCVSLYVVWFA